MAFKTLSAKNAAALDQDLMGTGGFSIDQLMELAGLSVSQAVYKVHPPSKGKEVLIACGPGNNGGDGLVCARHLYQYGYTPTVYYPKPSSPQLFTNLTTQLHALSIPFTTDFPSAASSTSLIIDALFGFSFKGPVRAPFDTVIPILSKPPGNVAGVLSVDVPSSWDVEDGPGRDGEEGFMPKWLISLTAPKPCIKHYSGTHFLGGRFVPPGIAEKYDFVVPEYQGVEQVVEVPVEGGGKL
ncbi:MAG: hypothetical protein Q9160_008727 [Pyrenula sp. 1 TL-2023]